MMNRKLLTAVTFAAVICGAGSNNSYAQWSFNFGYSEGYRHHHHGGHGHGYYGYNWWHRPHVDYVYVAAPPTVYVAPVAPAYIPVQPSLGINSSGATNTPSLASMPVNTTSASTTNSQPTSVRSNALPLYQGPGVVIRNPSGSGATLSFVVDDRRQMELSPGESSPLSERHSYSVSYDRGGDFGTARHVLGEGIYEFVIGEKGWELRRGQLKSESSATGVSVQRNALPTTTR